MIGTVASSALTAALAKLGPPGVVIGHRIISEGDENALFPSEIIALRTNTLAIRRQSGAARIVARQLLSTFGVHDAPLPGSESGVPVWPADYVGSLAHDKHVAVATAASAKHFIALGIDIEPADNLPPELVDRVANAEELERYPTKILQSRLLFVIKEAVYKATYPLHGRFLEFHDVTVNLEANHAWIRNVGSIEFAACTEPYVVALAHHEAPAIRRQKLIWIS